MKVQNFFSFLKLIFNLKSNLKLYNAKTEAPAYVIAYHNMFANIHAEYIFFLFSFLSSFIFYFR